MYINQFYNFLNSDATLQVYESGELLYTSKKEGLLPWLEYIGLFSPLVVPSAAFAKFVDNSSALLAVRAGCRRIYGSIGSRQAVKTLEKYHVKHRFISITSFNSYSNNSEFMASERESLNRDPDEYYELIRPQLLHAIA